MLHCSIYSVYSRYSTVQCTVYTGLPLFWRIKGLYLLVASMKLPSNTGNPYLNTLLIIFSFVIGRFFQCPLPLDAGKSSPECILYIRQLEAFEGVYRVRFSFFSVGVFMLTGFLTINAPVV
jgi:hypothetical protein